MILLLTVLFFASVNIGSLKVGVPDILQGMIGKGSEEVSTVFDLQSPEDFYLDTGRSCHGSFRSFVSGGSEKSTGRSGNHRNFQRCNLCRNFDHSICSDAVFLYTGVCIFWRGAGILSGVHSVVERRLKSFAGHSDRSRCECNVHRSFQRTQLHEWWKYVRGSGNRQRKYYDEDMG